MHQAKHFIVFHRTDGHCATWLVRAASIGDAMRRFYVEDTSGAELGDDGTIRTHGCGSTTIIFTHPLECFESELKSYDGLYGTGWEIRELDEQHLRADFAEVFCSADPDEIAGHIHLCRPLFLQKHPGSRARAFVWYLKTGPLVTFHRRKEKRCRHPIEILCRYHIPWNTWPQVSEWHGSYDAILDQLSVEYPLP
jgi:hypothetical protein